jgi:DNA repair exonuclease SbcCD ATPase subunit
MEFEKIVIDGLTRYQTPQSLELRQLPEGVIKIQGDNGSGKTTLLEAGLYAPLFGTLISRREPLKDFLHKKP